MSVTGTEATKRLSPDHVTPVLISVELYLARRIGIGGQPPLATRSDSGRPLPAALRGTGLDVWEVVETVKDEGN